MVWVDLQEGVLEEFASVAHAWRDSEFLTELDANRRARNLARNHEYYATVRLRPDVRARENAEASARRIRRRLDRAAARPPCPHCGEPVVRLGRTAKIPTFCSYRCTRAAIFARWYAKHGQARNERRRAA